MRGHAYAGLFAATRGKPESDPVTETCQESDGFVPEASANPPRSMDAGPERALDTFVTGSDPVKSM